MQKSAQAIDSIEGRIFDNTKSAQVAETKELEDCRLKDSEVEERERRRERE